MYIVQYATGVPFGAKYCNWGWGWKSSFLGGGGEQGGLRELGTFFSSWSIWGKGALT